MQSVAGIYTAMTEPRVSWSRAWQHTARVTATCWLQVQVFSVMLPGTRVLDNAVVLLSRVLLPRVPVLVTSSSPPRHTHLYGTEGGGHAIDACRDLGQQTSFNFKSDKETMDGNYDDINATRTGPVSGHVRKVRRTRDQLAGDTCVDPAWARGAARGAGDGQLGTCPHHVAAPTQRVLPPAWLRPGAGQW